MDIQKLETRYKSHFTYYKISEETKQKLRKIMADISVSIKDENMLERFYNDLLNLLK